METAEKQRQRKPWEKTEATRAPYLEEESNGHLKNQASKKVEDKTLKVPKPTKIVVYPVTLSFKSDTEIQFL